MMFLLMGCVVSYASAASPVPLLQCPQQELCQQASISILLDKINKHRSEGAGCFSESFAKKKSKSFFSKWSSKKSITSDALYFNEKLQKAALRHAADMAKYSFLDHNSRKTGSYQARVDKTGYRWVKVAENIAAGQMTVDAVLQAWLDSKQHCDLMVSQDYQEVGLACAINCDDPYGVYWALVLASPK